MYILYIFLCSCSKFGRNKLMMIIIIVVYTRDSAAYEFLSMDYGILLKGCAMTLQRPAAFDIKCFCNNIP